MNFKLETHARAVASLTVASDLTRRKGTRTTYCWLAYLDLLPSSVTSARFIATRKTLLLRPHFRGRRCELPLGSGWHRRADRTRHRNTWRGCRNSTWNRSLTRRAWNLS